MNETGAPKERIKLSIAPTYEVNEEVWGEVEEYLFTGFVSSPASIGEHSFVFKSLNHHEIKNIRFLRLSASSDAKSRDHFRACFIAHSVFMANGSNVIYERPRHINRLIRVISKIAPAMQDKIVDHLAAINKRATRLHPLIEVYVHENRSRFKWLQVRDIPVHNHQATGIAGTEELGMSYSQMTWTALNRVEDKRDLMEQGWSNAKFIGSCMAKGVRQIDEKDRSRAESERVELEERRMSLLQSYLNRTEYGEHSPRTIPLPGGRKGELIEGNTSSGRFRAETAEELREQLERALNGEKDHHDLVVERHFARLQQRSKLIQQQQRNMLTSVPTQSPSIPVAGGISRVMGSKAEVDDHLRRLEEARNREMDKTRRIQTDLSGNIREASDDTKK